MYRTIYCGELREEHIGQQVKVCGWVQRQRDLGALIFIDLRDRTGIVQLAFDENSSKDDFEKAFTARSEYVLCATGTVRSRGENAKNHNIPTGLVEIAVTKLEIITAAQTPPFEIVDNSNARDELRLKHRYLDLRRPELQSKIIARSKIGTIVRNFFADNGFIDVETPILVKSTPEGARDYLVPSRVHPGSFYALPQSPQLYKQLLMVSGFDRYFQIARCFRDEDLRADRQPEFTQIDIEMSFVDQEDVIEINERFLKHLFKEYKGIDIQLPLMRMPYDEAMLKYGCDKPDLRFGFEIVELTDILKDCGFKVFADTIQNGGKVRAINVKGGGTFTRKEIDNLTDFVKTQYKAKGLAWTKNNNGEISSSYAKFITEEENKAIYDAMGFESGDIIFIVADKTKVVCAALGALRCEVAKRMNIIDPNDYKLLWVTDFPMFEYDEEEDRYVATHHPFTAPRDEDVRYLLSDPAKVYSKAYDIIINGSEAGGGSVRIHTPEVQNKVFEAIGLSKEESEIKFGYLLEAFKYGVPPHAGLAYGFDRLVGLLLGTDAIRDVIAFPKVQNASELMTDCPSEVPQKSLDELSIALNLPKTEE
ncbi:MAG: aspartate--tRNA ligase [Ruminococcaceae bacterium]|nr:aspartate--tRNA ligase [Oscillospiraceae bacterium]